MPPRLTRSKTAPAKTSKNAEAPTTTKPQLPPSDEEPYRVFILPHGLVSPEARIISLPNPATSTLNRYYVCPVSGFYEFTKVAAPRTEPKSWLLVRDDEEIENEGDAQVAGQNKNGYVIQDADAFIATPVDPLFFLASLFPNQAVSGHGSGKEGSSSRLFRMEDDLLETLSASSQPLATLLQRHSSLRHLFLARLREASETRNVGDETLYRPDAQKLLAILLQKANRMTAPGSWPASMEETHIRRPLEAPTPIIHNQAATLTQHTQKTTTSSHEMPPDGDLPPAASPSSGGGDDVPEAIVHLQRTRVALDFLMTRYLPASLRSHIQSVLASPSTTGIPDFTPLTTHLSAIAALKSKAAALTSLSDNISRKRAVDADDDEAADARAARKRKKEEEEVRRKGESRAAKQLKKVDTSGMRKMSAFFGVKAPAPTPKLSKGETAP